jgi:hypothetical protein
LTVTPSVTAVAAVEMVNVAVFCVAETAAAPVTPTAMDDLTEVPDAAELVIEEVRAPVLATSWVNVTAPALEVAV